MYKADMMSNSLLDECIILFKEECRRHTVEGVVIKLKLQKHQLYCLKSTLKNILIYIQATLDNLNIEGYVADNMQNNNASQHIIQSFSLPPPKQSSVLK